MGLPWTVGSWETQGRSDRGRSDPLTEMRLFLFQALRTAKSQEQSFRGLHQEHWGQLNSLPLSHSKTFPTQISG